VPNFEDEKFIKEESRAWRVAVAGEPPSGLSQSNHY
jgi:hypothetical protein